jgi:RpiR family transcriptional regulator, carbohydrate utilization regulator
MDAIDSEVQARIPHNCLLKIQSMYDVLKSAERKAVDFLLRAPESVGGMTIVEFAHEAGCSEATVVRVAKRLGYEGYPELRRDFAQVADEVPSYHYESITDDDTPFAVFSKVVQSTIAALQDSLEIIAEDEYERAAEAIANADKMLFCGLGDAGVVATEAHYRFTRFGVAAYSAVDPDLQLMYASQLRDGDLIVAVSHSGRSRPILQTVEEARAAGATVVAITNYPMAPLAKAADIVLLTAVFTRYRNYEVMSKRVAQLCIIEALSINYLMRHGPRAFDQLKASNLTVDVNKV